ncbi:MAG: radical SAM protein [Pseudomonadota bacterium]
MSDMIKKIKILFNNIRALKNYHRKKVHLDNPPSFIWLEPTNHCNLKCIMCPTGTGMTSVKKGYMDYGLFKKIIDEVKDYTSAIILAVGGESLLHPQFFDMVRYASSNDIKILLNTNATLLTKEKVEQLLYSGIASISFAFDGFNKETYEKARVGADFEKTLDNIFYFLELKKRKEKKSPYTVLSILMLEIGDCSGEEKEVFLKKFNGLIDEVRLREVSTWGSTFEGVDTFNPRKHDRFFPPCSRLWSTVCITWNGDVVPCVYDTNHEYVIGNIKENKLIDIWNSNKMLKLRQSMLDGDYLDLLPLCGNCIVLGTPPIVGIPSGIRLSLTDAVTNFLGYRFEKIALLIANKLKKGKFSSITIE